MQVPYLSREALFAFAASVALAASACAPGDPVSPRRMITEDAVPFVRVGAASTTCLQYDEFGQEYDICAGIVSGSL